MKDQTQDDPILEMVPFEHCYLSELNPRREVTPEGIDQLAANIRALGLIQNLAGLKDPDGRVAIVGGGRRLRALAQLQDDPRFSVVPVQIAPNEAIARHWAAAENHQRVQLHPADEIESYRQLSESGATVPEIALAFGASEAHVYRRLALAGLPEPVLAALRANEITLGAAACFTVANDGARALEVLEQVRGNPLSERHLKSLLQPRAIASTDRRAVFVGRAAYLEAGGQITTDLFAEADYWTDPDLLDRLFAETLAKAAAELRDRDGWLWAETAPGAYLGYYEIEALKCARLYPEPGVLSEAENERHEALAEAAEMNDLSEADAAELAALDLKEEGTFTETQKRHAGLIAHVDHNGVLQATLGLVRPSERAAAIDVGVLQASRHTDSKPPRSPFSAALLRDMAAVTRGARQSALLDQGDLLLDLLAFQLSGRTGFERAFALRTDPVEIAPSTETGYAPDPRLKTALSREIVAEMDVAASFKRFRKQSKAKRKDALIRALAALVDPSDAMADVIDGIVQPDLRTFWQPTAENFFGRVNAGYLEERWSAFLGVDAAHPSATTFARLKKREKAEKLEELIASEETQTAYGLSAEDGLRLANWTPDLTA